MRKRRLVRSLGYVDSLVAGLQLHLTVIQQGKASKSIMSFLADQSSDEE